MRLAALVLLSTIAIQDPADLVEIHGTIDVADGPSKPARPHTGSFELWLRYRLEWHKLDVAVDDGAWKVKVPAIVTWADAGRMLLDGREASAVWGYEGDSSSSPGAVHAQWTHPVRLKVVDARTGEPLKDIEVVQSAHVLTPQAGGGVWPVAKGAPSPVPLPVWSLDPDPPLGHGWRDKLPFCVRAPGYAWKHIDVDVGRDVEPEVALERSGELVIDVSPDMRKQALWVAISRGSDDAMRLIALTSEPRILIESLEPRTYLVRLLSDPNPSRADSVLGTHLAYIDAGATRRVSFAR